MIPALASQAGAAATTDERPAGSPPSPGDAERPPHARESEHAPEFPPDIVLIVRSEGTVLYVNRPLGRRSEEEVVGSQLTDWVFPEQHAAVREALARVFASGRADGVELHGIQSHDPDAWFECRISPNQRDAKVVSVTVIARDVTRYKQIERALRETCGNLEHQLQDRTADLDLLRKEVAAGSPRGHEGGDVRLEEALQTAGEAIFLLDPATESVVDLNDTACRWLRRHRGDLLQQPVASLGARFPLLPPVDFDVQFTETRDLGRPLTLDGEHRRQDGSTFPVEVTVIGQVHDGREFYLSIARDVKDRRRAQEAIQEAEAQWRSLFEQSFDAVYLTTRGGEVVEANPAALELFGYRRDEFLGLDARTLMPDVNDIRRFQRTMATERFVARLEARLRRRDGTAFTGVLSASRRRDAHDRLLGYQWVVREAKPASEASAARETPAAAESEPVAPPTPTSHLPRFTPPEPMVSPALPAPSVVEAPEDEEDRPEARHTEEVARPEEAAPTPTPFEEWLGAPAPTADRDEQGSGSRVTEEVSRPEEVAPAPAPLDRWPGEPSPTADRGVVLLVGGRAAGRREAVQALERAGFAVLDAADGTEAIRMLRTHGDAVDVAVIAGESDVEPEDIARDLDALTHGLALVLVRAEGKDASVPDDLPEAMILREPVHPLALLQVVREARARS